MGFNSGFKGLNNTCQVLDAGSDLIKAPNLRNIQKTVYAYIMHALSGSRTGCPLVQAVLDRAHDS